MPGGRAGGTGQPGGELPTTAGVHGGGAVAAGGMGGATCTATPSPGGGGGLSLGEAPGCIPGAGAAGIGRPVGGETRPADSAPAPGGPGAGAGAEGGSEDSASC